MNPKTPKKQDKSEQKIPDCIRLTSTTLSKEELAYRQQLMLEAHFSTKSNTSSDSYTRIITRVPEDFEPTEIMNPNWRKEWEELQKKNKK